MNSELSLADLISLQNELANVSHAEQVFEAIQQQKKNLSRPGRWVWELLQNAKDAVESDETVSVKINLAGHRLQFSHTGNPFSLEELLKLIVQGSSKRDKEGKGGRFGTGFITSYMLSLKVTISGKLSTGQFFRFMLNRVGNNPEEFRINQQSCIEDLHRSLSNSPYTEDLFETLFDYELDEGGINAARAGLTGMDNLIPFVLGFNKKLRRVEIVDEGSSVIFLKSETPVELGPTDAIAKHQIEQITAQIEQSFDVYIISNETWQVIFCQRDVEAELVPSLFVAFPLLGTERLGLPISINSENFDVLKERDGIFLGAGSGETIKLNRNIFEQAIESLPLLVQRLARNEYSTGALAKTLSIKPHQQFDWLDHEWLQAVKIKLFNAVSELPVIQPYAGQKKLTLKLARIPFDKDPSIRKKLYYLHKLINPTQAVEDEFKDIWFEVISGWIAIDESLRQQLPNRLTLESLCTEVLEMGGYMVINQQVQTDDEIKSGIDWFNALIKLVIESDADLLTKVAIIPNQNFELITKTPSVFQEACLTDMHKEMVTAFGDAIRSRLLLPGINFPSEIIPIYSSKDAIQFSASKAAETKNEALTNLGILKGYTKLLKLLIDDKDDERLKSVDVIVSRSKDSERQFEKSKLLSGRNKLLAPKDTWRNNYPLFAEITDDINCLDNCYTDDLMQSDWEYLQVLSLLYCTPLVENSHHIAGDDLALLITDQSKLGQFQQADGSSRVPRSFATYELARFNATERNILSGDKKSKVFAEKILTFLIMEAESIDPRFKETIQISGADNFPVRFHVSVWLQRIKRAQWVPNEENGTIEWEKPSAKNLALLIKKNENLVNHVKSGKGLEVLKRMSISLSELFKHILATTDEDSMLWDDAFTVLLRIGITPMDASELLNDASTINDLLNKKLLRDRIKKNQSIGEKFEKAFESLIGKKDFADKDLRIVREPAGQDFMIGIQDQDIRGDDGKEVIFCAGGWHIELKAVGSDEAAMTPLQGDTAVRESHHYALIILPLNSIQGKIDHTTIIKYAMVIPTIGILLAHKHSQMEKMHVTDASAITEEDGIRIAIDKGNVRYNISRKIWTANSVSIESFIDQYIIPGIEYPK